MRFPHPYLAVAAFAGDGRWEVARVGEDVEDLQVAWGLAGPGDALDWRGDVAGSPAPGARELVDPAGKPLLAAVKVARTAKAEHRYTRGDGPRPPVDLAPLLNAPAPGSVPGGGPGRLGAPTRAAASPSSARREELVIPTPAAALTRHSGVK